MHKVKLPVNEGPGEELSWALGKVCKKRLGTFITFNLIPFRCVRICTVIIVVCLFGNRHYGIMVSSLDE